LTVKRRHIQITVVPQIGGAPIVLNNVAFALVQPQLYCSFQIRKQPSLNFPTGGFLEIYNLNDISAGSFDFKKDLNFQSFGSIVSIQAGYLSEGLRQIFTGVVVSATTYKEAPNYVTRIELSNAYYNIRRRNVRLVVAQGQTLVSALTTILAQAGLIVDVGFNSYLNTILAGKTFQKNQEINETLDIFLKRFEKFFPGLVKFSVDDAGLSPYPGGVQNPVRAAFFRIVNEATGMIGSPEVTDYGVNYSTELDGTLRIGDTAIIQSQTLIRLAIGSSIGAGRLTTLVPNEIEHVADNRDGPFQTNVQARFQEIAGQAL
jgi:hypothetical protein